METDALGTRMKEYEFVPRNYLLRRTPVIIRIDGKAFHTFTRGLNRPFDKTFQKCMVETVKYLCANVQNCVLGYTQSDEITLVLLDDFKLNTSPYFDNQVEKICSITASMATLAFNQAIYNELESGFVEGDPSYDVWKQKLFKAQFDSRCFNVPNRTEVYNCLVWRQQDAIKNSITMLALSHFSNKQLHKKNGKEKITMLEEIGVRWNELDNIDKQGIIIKKVYYDKNGALRSKWEEDVNTPVFTKDPDYIMKLLNKEGE